MKRILLLVLVFISLKVFAQYPQLGIIHNDSALTFPKGALLSRLINRTFTDTTAANLQRIRQYPGAQIFTTSDNLFWLRNSTATAWLQQSGGGGGSGTVTSVGLTSSDITVGGTVSPITTSGTYTLTLPNINADIGTFNNLTVNAKGQVTAASNVAYLTSYTETDPIASAINGILKSNGTTLSAAVAGTDYQAPITLTTTGTSGAATFVANTLNIPQYGGGSGWSLTGNAGTVAGTNFLGTTDAINLRFKVNSVSSGRINHVTPFHTSFGYNAIPDAATGTNNSAFGFEALKSLSTGLNNTAIGWSALKTVSTGTGNTAIGQLALTLATGTANTAIGNGAAQTLATGDYNLAIGASSLRLLSGGSGNTAIGAFSLENNTNQANVAIGQEALKANTSAYYNTGIGYQVMISNQTGIQNTAIGRNALFLNTGANNTAIGEQAGSANTTGASNVFIGRTSGAGIAAGSNKLYIHNAATSATIYGDMSTGQVQINAASTPAITASAQFEVISTTRGLLLPRMTTTQRDAIASPVAGLLIYNTTTNKLNVYTTVWEAVTSL